MPIYKMNGTTKIARLSGVTQEEVSSAVSNIQTSQISNGAITTDKVSDSAITTNKLSDASVSNDKLADNSITSSKIKDGAIGTTDIADSSITTAKIATGAVGTSDIADKAVTSQKIDWTTFAHYGWEVLDELTLSANTTGTAPLVVNIPPAYRGYGNEYKIELGYELGDGNADYPYLQPLVDTTWQTGNVSFTYYKCEGGSTQGYTGDNVNPLAFEWHHDIAHDSCTATVKISNVGPGNFWNAYSRGGGFTNAKAATFMGGARTGYGRTISAFRINSALSHTWLIGSHITLFGRKYA